MSESFQSFSPIKLNLKLHFNQFVSYVRSFFFPPDFSSKSILFPHEFRWISNLIYLQSFQFWNHTRKSQCFPQSLHSDDHFKINMCILKPFCFMWCLRILWKMIHFHISCVLIKFHSTFCGHFMFFNEILSEALHFKKWKDLICISSKFSCVSDYGFEMSAHKISIRNCTLGTLLDKKRVDNILLTSLKL